MSSLSELLENLTSSLSSATKSVPNASEIIIPQSSFSLLDVKNELFLAYLENLVFLIIIKLRHHSTDDKSKDEATSLRRPVVEQLAKLRVLLEKGVKPVEGKLKFQVEKVIRAAEETSNGKNSGLVKKSIKNESKMSEGTSDSNQSNTDEDESEDDQFITAAPRARALQFNAPTQLSSSSLAGDRISQQSSGKPGIYVPPRHAPTSLPTTDTSSSRQNKDKVREPRKSALLDTYIADELSAAPTAEPSIGTSIRSGGREMLSVRERKEAAEKQRYEEENFVRLREDKAEMKRQRGRKKMEQFGGEEWAGLERSLGRIGRLVDRKRNGAGALEKSRKRLVDDGFSNGGKRRKYD